MGKIKHINIMGITIVPSSIETIGIIKTNTKGYSFKIGLKSGNVLTIYSTEYDNFANYIDFITNNL